MPATAPPAPEHKNTFHLQDRERNMPEEKETFASATDDQDTGVSEAGADAPLDVPVVPVPGVVIDERYEIVSLLGKGGMCTVYKARHLLMDRPVALKMLHEELVIDRAAMQRFQREAVAVSALDHPNIVKIFGFGLVGNLPYMAMEFLEGLSLANLVKQERRLPKERALPIFNQILDALAHAHEKGILHRDLKPNNVMLVGPNNQVKLVDFGIAKILPESGKELMKLTQTGEVFGTVVYMSPEQCVAAPLDARSDLYSMGCLMFEVLDGEPPLKGDAPYLTIAKHVNEAPRASDFLADDFGSVVFSALEKNPAHRPQSAIALKGALNNPASFLQKHVPRKNHKKNRAAKWLISLGVILLIVASLTFLGNHRLPPQQDQNLREIDWMQISTDLNNADTELSQKLFQQARARYVRVIHDLDKTKLSGQSVQADRSFYRAYKGLARAKAKLGENPTEEQRRCLSFSLKIYKPGKFEVADAQYELASYAGFRLQDKGLSGNRDAAEPWSEAESLCKNSLASYRKIVSELDTPLENPIAGMMTSQRLNTARSRAAKCLSLLASIYEKQGRAKESVKASTEALKIQSMLYEDDPSDTLLLKERLCRGLYKDKKLKEADRVLAEIIQAVNEQESTIPVSMKDVIRRGMVGFFEQVNDSARARRLQAPANEHRVAN
jgi:serine/threonine protein kinase